MVVVRDVVMALVMMAARQGVMGRDAAVAMVDFRHAVGVSMAAMFMTGSAVLAIQALFAPYAADLANALALVSLVQHERITVRHRRSTLGVVFAMVFGVAAVFVMLGVVRCFVSAVADMTAVLAPLVLFVLVLFVMHGFTPYAGVTPNMPRI